MPPARRPTPPSAPVQSLLLKHLAAMRASFVRDLMRENGIKGLSNNKDKLLGLVGDALRDRELAWDTLIAFLDRHEPNGKQRVLMLKAPHAQRQQFTAAALKAALEDAGLDEAWDATVPVAAPEELQLSSVGADGNMVHVVAIGRRSYRQRVTELEGQVDLPRDDLEVQLYERVEVRGWVRAELDTRTGALNIRAVSLPQERAQRALFEDFSELIAPWFPLDLFEPLDLRKAIKALHDDECAGMPCEALVQAVGYDDASGRKTSLRSAAANQSVNGASPQLQAAIDAVRASGEGADGNFFFLPTAMGGPPNVPIGKDPVRVIIKAAAGRLDFTKPHDRRELAHVLHRVRVLAS
jgi:hypothetical protein